MTDNFGQTLKLIFSDYGQIILTGLGNTLLIALCAFVIGTVIGILIAVIKLLPKTNLFVKILDKIATFYVSLFRGTPVVVQLLLFYFAILSPLGMSAIVVGIIIFGLNSGAYMSEIMRAGIQSVDIGQMEAGRSLGLTYGAAMSRIVIPQAVKNIVPTMSNELISLLKETSVAGFITVMDLTRALQAVASATYDVFTPYIVLAVFYYVLVVIANALVRLLERRLRRSDRRN